MKALNRYLRPHARQPLWLWVAAGLSLVAGAAIAVATYQQHRAVAQAMARNEHLRAMQAAAAPPVTSRAEQDEQARWAHLKLERDFPWPQVFQAVERTASPDIELLQFKPDKLNRKIALSGEARNRKALIAYLAALANQPQLNNVYLVHQQTVQRDTLETIAFDIKAALVQ